MLTTGLIGKERYVGEVAKIVIPENWEVTSGYWIEAANEMAAQNNLNGYDGGFYYMPNEAYPFAFPSFSYKFYPVNNFYSGQNIESVLTSIASDMSNAFKAGYTRNFIFDGAQAIVGVEDYYVPYVNNEKRIVFTTIETSVEDVEPAIGVLAMIPLNGGYLQLNFNTLKKDWGIYFPIFSDMMSSISVVEGMEFPSAQVSSSTVLQEAKSNDQESKSDYWDKILLAAFIGGLIAWYRYWKNKNKDSKITKS